MWPRRQLEPDGVARPHHSVDPNDRHHAGLANHIALLIVPEQRSQEARLDAIELSARISQAHHFDGRRVAESQQCPSRQTEQVHAERRDVLAHLAGAHVEARRLKLIVQLGMNQMHLAQIGLARVARHSRAMPDGRSHVRVTLDSQPREQPDAGPD